MIFETNETMRSMEQDLTFESAFILILQLKRTILFNEKVLDPMKGI